MNIAQPLGLLSQWSFVKNLIALTIRFSTHFTRILVDSGDLLDFIFNCDKKKYALNRQLSNYY